MVLAAAGIGRKAGYWVQEMRLPFLTVSVLPVIFGAVAARALAVPVDPVTFALAFVAAVFMHIGANVVNDFFDHLNGTDDRNKEFVHGFTGGSRVIQEGMLSQRDILIGAIIFLSFGFATTVYLALTTGGAILVMGMVALAAAVTYSLCLHSLYIGELVVGLCFGTLISAGSFYIQAGYVSPVVLLASVPMGLLVFLILFLNEIPDYTADRASGKITLVVRLGREKASHFYAGTLAVVYAYTAATAVVLRMPLLLLSFLTVPLAVYSSARLMRHCNDSAQLRPSIISTILLFTVNSLVLIAAFAAEGV